MIVISQAQHTACRDHVAFVHTKSQRRAEQQTQCRRSKDQKQNEAGARANRIGPINGVNELRRHASWPR